MITKIVTKLNHFDFLTSTNQIHGFTLTKFSYSKNQECATLHLETATWLFIITLTSRVFFAVELFSRTENIYQRFTQSDIATSILARITLYHMVQL